MTYEQIKMFVFNQTKQTLVLTEFVYLTFKLYFTLLCENWFLMLYLLKVFLYEYLCVFLFFNLQVRFRDLKKKRFS